jgi:nicotinate phosphoribosyltransferase
MNDRDRRIAEGILFTDLYQLTMAQLYFRMGMHERPARFDHFFRKNPDYGQHQAGFCINAGLEWLLDWMAEARFGAAELACLRGQQGRSGRPLFADDFLDWLAAHGNFEAISMRAVPEGRVVHAGAPLTMVEGPLAMAQILETSLLNHLNYQTLIATKAARVHAAGLGRMVLEFGMRRGPAAGASAGVRAALIGGADYSSDVGISCTLGLPAKGTHAHSMVQAFMALSGSELDAFRAFAEVYPDDCLLLVDTVNTLESGIPNAIKVFGELRRKGHAPVGIRLDSGDLAYLAIQAAKMLDRAGFPDTVIVLSNELDELVIWQIITQIREEGGRNGVDPDRLIKRLVYGVGTRLITSMGAPALDGVYKMVAIGGEGGWQPAIKISETPAKTINPGCKQVWRLYDRRGRSTADLICLDGEEPAAGSEIVLRHPIEYGKMRRLARQEVTACEPLLVEVLRRGTRVEGPADLEAIRARRRHDIELLDQGVRRFVNPHIYHVSVSPRLWDLKQQLISRARRGGDGEPCPPATAGKGAKNDTAR